MNCISSLRASSRRLTAPVNMITKYITSVSTVFSPFNARTGKTVRNFLALLPPNARSKMAIDVKMSGQREAEKPASLSLKFSMCDIALGGES